ncbi:MAG: hypothetical protein ABJA74_05180 [Lapillicoccus sp.]
MSAMTSPTTNPGRKRALNSSRNGGESWLSVAETIAASSGSTSSAGRSVANAARAWLTWPRRTKNRGLDGTRTAATSWATAVTPPRANIHRHCPPGASSSPVAKATRMPTVMNSWYVVRTVPRRANGASSARYSGPTADVIPTETPVTKRPSVMSAAPAADAVKTTPTSATTAAPMSVRRRPTRSADVPATTHPMSAPATRLETTTAALTDESCSSVLTDAMASLFAAVSAVTIVLSLVAFVRDAEKPWQLILTSMISWGSRACTSSWPWWGSTSLGSWPRCGAGRSTRWTRPSPGR